MNIQYLRASSIKTYEGCQFQFFLDSILEIPSGSGKKALLGTIVHHVLEIMARATKLGHKDGLLLDHVKLLDICWKRYKIENTGKIELADGADKKFCLKSIEKVLGTKYDPRNLKVLHTERQFRIPLTLPGFTFEYYDVLSKKTTAGNYEIRGTIDLITKLDDQTLEIIDWKTGSRKSWETGELKEYDYFASKDIQLRMYDLAVSMLYPQYKTRLLTIHFVNDGGPFTVCFDDDQRKETLNIIKEQFNTIKGNHLPTRIKEVNGSQAWKCKTTCHFGKTKTTNGCSVCDNVFNYLVANGIDIPILRVVEVRKSKAEEKALKTSDRRNTFKDDQ
jgi:hypothetical protein